MTRAERGTLLVAGVVAIASVLVLGVIAAAWATLPHQLALSVDGRVVHVPWGSSVGDVARLGYVRAGRGDILSVAGGVARAGGGGEPTIVRNGRMTSMDQPVYDGDVVTSTRGADITERTVVATEEVPASTRFLGKGPISVVSRTGSPGIVRVVKGAVSGSVVASDVLVPPKAAIVRRTTPRPNHKIVALTFDDGPWPVSTLAILRILQKEKVPATFFMLGGSAGRRPSIARRVAAAGMLVGSHSLGHKDLTKLSKAGVRREIVYGVRRVARVTHQEQRWFRPPYGAVDAAVLSEVRANHLRMAGWTIDSGDWTRPGAAKIVRNVVNRARPGSIILMHDGGGERSQTVKALPYLIHELKRRGYTFVTLDEMATHAR